MRQKPQSKTTSYYSTIRYIYYIYRLLIRYNYIICHIPVVLLLLLCMSLKTQF